METTAEKTRRVILDRNNWGTRATRPANTRLTPEESRVQATDPNALADLARRMMAAESLPGPVKDSFIFVWTFTPEDASIILDQTNYGNRVISRRHVEELKAEQMSGKWVPNVDPIVLGPKMRLLGGQHRLSMVRETGVATTFIVVLGATEEMKFGLDRGKPWSIADKLDTDKEAVAAVRVIVGLSGGFMGRDVRDSEVRDTLSRFDIEITKALGMLRARRSLTTAPCVAAFAIALRDKKHSSEIENLAKRLSTYADDSEHVSRSILRTLEQYGTGATKRRCLLSLRLLDRLYEYATGMPIPETEKPTTIGLKYFFPEAKAAV